MNRIIYFVIALFSYAIPISAQQPAVTIVSAESCADREVVVSVVANDLMNIAAITLKITFNNEKLVLSGIENISEELEGLVTNLTNNPPMVAIAWSNVIPVNFENSKLFDLRFITRDTPGEVYFDNGCEIADKEFNIIQADYLDGIVGDARPVITEQPYDVRKNSGSEASFTVTAVNASGYQWERSSDNGLSWNELTDDEAFTGAKAAKLRIEKVLMGLNGTMFRCITKNELCFTVSASAKLQVDSLLGINEKAGIRMIEFTPAYHAGNNDIALNYRIQRTGDVTLTVYNILGRVLFSKRIVGQSAGRYSERFTLAEGNTGICFCTLSLNENNNRYVETKKLMIID